MVPWIAAVILASVTGVTGWFVRPVPDPPRLHFELQIPEGQRVDSWDSFAVSPDGTKLVYGATDTLGVWRLYLRDFREAGVRSLEGTEGSMFPFWSPDSRQVAYAQGGADRLYRVSIEGGAPVPVCPAPGFRGAAWLEDATILYAPAAEGPLYRISVQGGEPEPVTGSDSSRFSHRWPSPLPGGDRFLYLETASDHDGRIFVGSLSDPDFRKHILDVRSGAVFHDGCLFYVRDNILHAQKFDPGSLTLGETRVVASSVSETDGPALAKFSVGSGMIVVADVSQGMSRYNRLIESDREGNEVGAHVLGGFVDDVTATPDGARIAVMVETQGKADIWMIDTERGIRSRLSFDGQSDDPAISPDGRELAFASEGDVYRRRVDAAAEPELVLGDDRDIVPHQWTAQGEIIYCTGGGGNEILGRIDLASGEDRVLRQGNFRYMLGQVSPDGRWITYVCDETGDLEVYVEDYPDLSTRLRISRNGGTFPLWGEGGRKLWYMDSTNRLHEVSLNVSNGGLDVVSDDPRFQVGAGGWGARTHAIAVSDDGNRIFSLRRLGDRPTVLRAVSGWRFQE